MPNREKGVQRRNPFAAEERPDRFSIQNGDLHFLDWRIPLWLSMASQGPIMENLFNALTKEDAA